MEKEFDRGEEMDQLNKLEERKREILEKMRLVESIDPQEKTKLMNELDTIKDKISDKMAVLKAQ